MSSTCLVIVVKQWLSNFFLCYRTLCSNLFSHETPCVCKATWTWGIFEVMVGRRGVGVGPLLPLPAPPPAGLRGLQEQSFVTATFSEMNSSWLLNAAKVYFISPVLCPGLLVNVILIQWNLSRNSESIILPKGSGSSLPCIITEVKDFLKNAPLKKNTSRLFTFMR